MIYNERNDRLTNTNKKRIQDGLFDTMPQQSDNQSLQFE